VDQRDALVLVPLTTTINPTTPQPATRRVFSWRRAVPKLDFNYDAVENPASGPPVKNMSVRSLLNWIGDLHSIAAGHSWWKQLPDDTRQQLILLGKAATQARLVIRPTDNVQLVSGLAEDLSVEILSQFKAEDYQNLGHTIQKLIQVERVLTDASLDVPFPVREVLKNYRLVTN
jgi:hypothetical protein